MDTFFKSLVAVHDELSNLEKQVLDYFLKKPEIIATHTLEEIAEKVFVSTATISRTCKKLGFSGFQELKYSFISYQERNSIDNRKVENISTTQDHLDRFEKEIENTFPKIGYGITKELIELIKKSQHVEFFGVGSSLPLCIEGARKMTFANRLATTRSDWDELRVVAKNLGKNDLAILISLSGETLHILEYAQILKDREVPFLAITGNEGSQLERFADYSLSVPIQTMYYQEVDMSSRFPLSMVIDLLVLNVINFEK